MTTLAIDTCEANCSAAFLMADGQVFACTENIGRGHAERLLPMIEELLTEASLRYADISRIAVTTGPGTFTGLRIGLSVARGLALSLGIPCIGVSALTVLAAQAKAPTGPIHSVLKGRGGQVFYQAFEGVDAQSVPKPVCDAANLDADDAHHEIERRSGYVLGSGVSLVMGRETGTADGIDTPALARLSLLLAPEDFPPEPFYLRAADAVKAKPLIKISDK